MLSHKLPKIGAGLGGEMKHKSPAVKLLLDLEIPSSYSWHASRSNHRWAGVSLGGVSCLTDCAIVLNRGAPGQDLGHSET